MNINPNEPWHPSVLPNGNNGATIRTEIASRAMAALISANWSVSRKDQVAEMAIEFTDALIEKLNKPLYSPPIEIVGHKEWEETEAGWISYEWADDDGQPIPSNYSMSQEIDTDKHGHPTKAIFKIEEPNDLILVKLGQEQ